FATIRRILAISVVLASALLMAEVAVVEASVALFMASPALFIASPPLLSAVMARSLAALMPLSARSSTALISFRASSVAAALRLACSPTWSTFAWIGAVVFLTYFFVAHPPVSIAPDKMIDIAS